MAHEGFSGIRPAKGIVRGGDTTSAYESRRRVGGQGDSALFYFTAFDRRGLSSVLVDALWHPLVLRRLGELHEQRGEIEKAIPYYDSSPSGRMPIRT